MRQPKQKLVHKKGRFEKVNAKIVSNVHTKKTFIEWKNELPPPPPPCL